MGDFFSEKNACGQKELYQKLAVYYQYLVIMLGFFCLGWPIIMIGIAADINLFTLLPGSALASAPMLIALWKGRGLSPLFFWKNEQTAANWMNMAISGAGKNLLESADLPLKLLASIAIVIFGSAVSVVMLTYFTMCYSMVWRRVQNKPAFATSAFPVLIAGLAVFIFGGVNIATAAASRSEKTNKSDYTMRQIRSIITETQKQLLANSYSYHIVKNIFASDAEVQTASPYSVMVRHNGNTQITTVEILGPNSRRLDDVYRSGINNPVLGKFTFKNNIFAGYEDTQNENLPQPSKDEVAHVRNFLPEFLLFEPFFRAKDTELYAKKSGNSHYSLTAEYWRGGPDGKILLYLKKHGAAYKIFHAFADGTEFAVNYH